MVYLGDGARQTPVGRLLIPRFFHRLVALGDDLLLALGGETKGGHTALIEVLDLRSDRPLVQSWEAPLPTRARNRQGMLLDGESLWLFGGGASGGW